MRIGHGITHPPSITPQINPITIKELLRGKAPGRCTTAAAAAAAVGLLQRDLALDQGVGGKGPATRGKGRRGGEEREKEDEK
jgi:hypothetical protein